MNLDRAEALMETNPWNVDRRQLATNYIVLWSSRVADGAWQHHIAETTLLFILRGLKA